MKYSRYVFLDSLQKRIAYGKVRKKISLFELKKEQYSSLRAPAFFLSTGRCRTHWITTILAEQRNILPLHNPEISFLEEGRIIYESLTNSTETEKKLILQLVSQARDAIWLNCAKRDIQFVETNNRITFAAPFLIDLIPHSKFVHVTRHPVDFIISGMNRDWYKGNSHDLGRIVMNDSAKWEKLSQTQKIAWLWLETNMFILQSISGLSSDRVFSLQSENLDLSRVVQLVRFLKLDEKRIPKKWLRTKTNTQKNRLGVMKEAVLEEIKSIDFFVELDGLAKELGYNLEE